MIGWNFLRTLHLVLKHFWIRLTTKNLTPFLWLRNVKFLPSEISVPESFPGSHLLQPETVINLHKHPACHSEKRAKPMFYGIECQFASSFRDATPNLTSPISFGPSPFTRRGFSILALLHKQQEPWKHPKMKTDCAWLTIGINMQQQYTVWRIIHPNSSSTCGLVAFQTDSMQKTYTFPLCRASAFLFCNSPFTNGPTTRRSRNLRACDKSAAAFFRRSADGSCKYGNPGGWKHWLQSYSL